MIIKSLPILLMYFCVGTISAQCDKNCKCPTKQTPCNLENTILDEILKINKKLDSLITGQFLAQTKGSDTTKHAKLALQLKTLSDSIIGLKSSINNITKDLENQSKSIQTLETNQKKILQSQEKLITDLCSNTKLDKKTFLELYLNSFGSETAPSNIDKLKEFQSISNLLDDCEGMINVDFVKLSLVKKKLDELKTNEQKINSFPGLSTTYKRVLPLMDGYEQKIKELNDHLERYYVTYKNSGSKDIDRIMYLQDQLINFKDYPYLLKLVFDAMDKPNGTNLVKSKLN